MTVEVPAHALRLWRTLAGDDAVLAPCSASVVRGTTGLAPPGWIGVLRLGDALVIEAGEASDAAIEQLLALSDPGDPASISAALNPHDTLGPAGLGYLVADGVTPRLGPPHAGLELREGSAGDLDPLLAATMPEEADESSVAQADHPVLAFLEGAVVGAAFHLSWPADIAHLGVLVSGVHRGRGIGTAVAAGAVTLALEQGLHPQWRAARNNHASRAVGRRLGFVEVGHQFSFRLEPGAPSSRRGLG